jgi:hypothetical protein
MMPGEIAVNAVMRPAPVIFRAESMTQTIASSVLDPSGIVTKSGTDKQ